MRTVFSRSWTVGSQVEFQLHPVRHGFCRYVCISLPVISDAQRINSDLYQFSSVIRNSAGVALPMPSNPSRSKKMGVAGDCIVSLARDPAFKNHSISGILLDDCNAAFRRQDFSDQLNLTNDG